LGLAERHQLKIVQLVDLHKQPPRQSGDEQLARLRAEVERTHGAWQR